MSRSKARQSLARPIRAAIAASLTATALAVPALPAHAAPPPSGVDITNLSNNDAPSGHPAAASAGDHVYQVWTDFGYDPRGIGSIVLKVSNDGGVTYPISRLLSMGMSYSEQPDVAAAGDSAYVVWQATTGLEELGSGNREIYFQAIHGGGVKPAQMPMNLSTDAQDSVFPHVVVAPGGWVLVTWRGLNGDVHLAYSSDDGRSFTKMLLAQGAQGGDVSVADGTAYVITTAPGNAAIDVTPIRLQRDKPGAPLVADPATHIVTGQKLGDPHIAAWGATVHAIWTDVSGTRPAMQYARSTDSGMTWSTPTQMSPADGFGGMGDLSVDTRGVWVASTWLNRSTVVQHSTDLGESWDAPVTLTDRNTGGLARFSKPQGAVQTTPQPAVDWRMPDRYGLDRNNDGLIDYNTSAEYLRPSSYKVMLDGCSSTGGDSPITKWRWTVEGSTTEVTTCRTTREFSHQGVFPVTLEIETADGDTAKVLHDVTVKDYLIISVGDSVASGEGVPDIPGTGTLGTDAVWQDKRCHRSAVAGPSQGALRLEKSDPRSSVTFLHLACSGASVMEDIYNGLQISGGGLLTPYEGIIDPGGAPLPPQVTEAKELTAGRDVDALLVSIGANDQKFSSVVKGCITDNCGPGTQIERDFLARNARLQNHYNALANQLGSWVEPSHVFLTEYFDPTHDQTGGVNLRCVADGLGERVTDEETTWAFDTVMRRLITGVQEGVKAHGWTYVGGIADAFTSHGYCAQDPWVVQIGQSFKGQGDENGGFHPNPLGHEWYGRQIGDALLKAMPPIAVPEMHEPQREDTGGDIHVAIVDAGTAKVVPLVATNGVIQAKAPIAMPRSGPNNHDDVQLVTTDTGVIATYVDNQNPDLTPNMRYWEVMAARVQTAAENLKVRDVTLVQGPDDASFVVAGKATAVRAEIVSTLKTTQYVRVALHADRTATGPVDSTSTVALHPGVNVVHLHAPHDLLPSPDSERFAVRVEVDSDHWVDEAIETDNVMTTRSLPIEITRPLRLLFVPLQQAGENATSCAAVEQLVGKARPYLQSALPVADGQLTAQASCAAAVQVRGDVAWTLGVLDALATSTGYDAVVGVARSGWFAARAGSLSSAVGAALGGASGSPRNGIVVEAGFGGPLVAHEIGHLFGAEHETTPASGYAVAQREVHNDFDVMHPATTEGRWVGAGTFRMLATQLASTAPALGAARTLADGTPSSLLVDGLLRADGSFETGAWSQTDLPANVQLGAEGPLTLRYVGDGGQTLATVGLQASAGEGAGSAATTANRSVVARVPLVDGTRRYVLVRGSDVLLDRVVSASAPTVQVISPAAGSSVNPNGSIDVAWTASDADGDALTYDVALSSDGGVSWVPAVRGLTGTTAKLTVDRKLAGASVIVRVTASDGVRSTATQSAPVAVTANLSPGKIAFEVSREVKLPDRTWPVRWTTVSTINPDGSELNHITEDLKAVNHPVWSPDGSTLAVEVPNYFGAPTLMLMDGDGTNRRMMTGLATDFDIGSCPAWSPDGKALAFTFAGIWITNIDGTGTRQVADTTLGSDENGNGGVWQWDCSDWSPDGTTLAFMGKRSGDDIFHLMTVNVDGTGFRDITKQASVGTYNWDPLWPAERVDFSPEGELVFKRDDGIFAIQPDGTGLRKLFTSPYNVGWHHLGWSPDGSQLYGSTNLNAPGYSDLGIINPDGTGGRNITKFPYESPKREAYFADWGVVRDLGEPGPAPRKLADAGGPYSTEEGSPVILDATRGDRPDGEIPLYAWDLDGDGKYDDAFGATVPFTPVDDGDVKVGLRVTTSGGKTATAQAVVHVTNAAPVVSVVGDRVVVGQEFTLPVMVSDPGVQDELTVYIDWGDDTDYDVLEVVNGQVPGAKHVYDSVGGRLVNVEACDDSGACTSETIAMSVLASAPPRVQAALPDHGDKRGGTEVVINGSLLSGATSVHFGSVPATTVRVVSDRQVIATAPPLPGGNAVDVTVTSAGGTSAAVPNARFRPDNTAPEIADATVSTSVDMPVRLSVDASDADGDALTLTVTGQPTHGSVSGPDASGVFTYTPAAGWNGSDSFAVQVDDGVETARAVVNVRVGSRAPLPGNDTVTLPVPGGTIDVAYLLANDVDPEGDAVSVVSVDEPNGAVTAVARSGDTVNVTIGSGVGGSFRYTVRDATGMESTATVFVSVSEAHGGAPFIAEPAHPAIGNEGDVLATTGRFVDPDGDPLTITLNGPGTLVADADGRWTWSLPTRNEVSGTFTITATDGKDGSVTDTVTFRADNVAPFVGEPTVTGGACGSAVGLVATVTDPGADDVVTTVVDWGDGSTSKVGPAIDLSHAYKEVGTYTVTITATDDTGASSSRKVSVSTTGGTRPGEFDSPLSNKAALSLGSTVPVKISIRGCTGAAVTNLAPRLSMVLVSGGSERPVIVAPSGNSNDGDVMRVTGQSYLYNLSLKNSRFVDGGALVTGTYRIRVSDPSFVNGPAEVTVTLQK